MQGTAELCGRVPPTGSLRPRSSRSSYRGAGVGAPEAAGGPAVGPEAGKVRTRSSKVMAASTQLRMDPSSSHRTASRVSPIRRKKPAARE